MFCKGSARCLCYGEGVTDVDSWPRSGGGPTAEEKPAGHGRTEASATPSTSDSGNPPTSRAQRALDLFTRGVRDKEARRSAAAGDDPSRGTRLAQRLYEDEPILQTAAQLAARQEYEAREAYRFATGHEPQRGRGSSDASPRARTLGDLAEEWQGDADDRFELPDTPALAAGKRDGMGRAVRPRWQMTGGAEREGSIGATRPVRLVPSRPSAAEERIPPRPGSAGAQVGQSIANREISRESLAGIGVGDGSRFARPEGESRASRYVPAARAPERNSASWGDLWSDLTLPPSLPPQYGDVRKLARDPEARRHSDAWLFCRQGRVLAAVEDDCPYTGTFERYYPTYNAMTDRQLRGYITWRTQLRRGIVTKTSTSFAFVYIYELLNGIGVDSLEDAYRELRRFWDEYRDLESAADRYMRTWLRDFVVYHGLPRALIADDPALSKELILDEAMLVLMEGSRHTPDERFGAWATLSSYRIRSSRFYKEYPTDVQSVVLGVMDRLAAYYAKGSRKHDLFETLFGEKARLPCEMFRACVFEDVPRHPDATYELDAINRFTCVSGNWTHECYQGNRRESSKLGSILKEIDARMRLRYGYAHPLREEKTPKYLLAFIEKEIDAWLSWKAAHAPRVIEIDRSKLGGIRGDAAVIREELLIDEERGEQAAGFGSPVVADARGLSAESDSPSGDAGCACQESAVAGNEGEPGGLVPASVAPERSRFEEGPLQAEETPAAEPHPDRPSNSSSLSVQELAFVRGLLAGDSSLPPGPVGSVDMLVDAVNERLFDELGDTAIEFGPDGPAIIEDYADDVRGIVGA